MKNISITNQESIVRCVQDTATTFEMQLSQYRQRMLRIYKAVSTFESLKSEDWYTAFKVNKAFEIENKVLPRLIANKPKWIVSARTDSFDEGDELLSPEDRALKLKNKQDQMDAIRDYLAHVFQKQDLEEVVELRARSGVRYGIGRGRVSYKYDYSIDTTMEEVYDEEGNSYKEKTTKRKVVSEYPTIDTCSWSDILYDPRYIRLEDFPAIIETKRGIRMSFFTKDAKKYLNVDKLIDICNIEYEDSQQYKKEVYAVSGINYTGENKISANSLTVKKYYGWYEMSDEKTGKKEKLYEFWTVNNVLLVYAKEITQLPFQDFKCFRDTETFLATGFIEPIISLQEELNFKKNSTSTYINQSLHRSWIWSPNSGINPKHLNSAPGNIIPTTKDVTTAMTNLQEVPYRQVPPAYFQEQNDFERQIQSMSFTIDTSSQQGNQSLTNTATGIKVKAFESNSVMNMVRDNFEQALVLLAYKFLQETADNLDDNAIIKKLDDDGFREINKEAFRDALRRYEIRIEAGSTSFDTMEQRRANAIAQSNIALQYAGAGVAVNLDDMYKQVMMTFEGVDETKLLKPQDPMAMMQPQQPQGGGSIPMPTPTENPTNIPV